MAFRLIPYRHRFDAVRYLAMALLPLIRRTDYGRSQVAMGLDTAREVTMFAVLRTLTRMGCRFCLQVRNSGDRFERGENGVLITGAHITLLYAMFREMSERGFDPGSSSKRPTGCSALRTFRAESTFTGRSRAAPPNSRRGRSSRR